MRKILLLTIIYSGYFNIAQAENVKIYETSGNGINRFVDTNILILDSILALNLSSYIGKPVDSLLMNLPQSPKTIRITSSDRPHIASRLIITYNGWYWIQIVVKNFQYMPVYDPNRIWDFNLFKSEVISWIFINRGNECIFGCSGSKFRN